MTNGGGPLGEHEDDKKDIRKPKAAGKAEERHSKEDSKSQNRATPKPAAADKPRK